MLWLRTSGRASKIVARESGSPLQSEMSTSTAVRDRAGGWRRRWPRSPRTAVGQVVAGHVVTTAWARPSRSTASATRSGSLGVEGQRVCGCRPGRSRTPGCSGAVDHEGGGAVGPALVDVGAAGLLAHRDQLELARSWRSRGSRRPSGLDPQPLRLARGHGRPAAGVDAGRGQSPVERPPGLSGWSRGDGHRIRARCRSGAAPIVTRWRVGRAPDGAGGGDDGSTTSAMVTSIPSAASDVTGLSAIPHGTMWSNVHVGATLRAKPCMDRPRDPDADGADLAGSGGARWIRRRGSTHTPG